MTRITEAVAVITGGASGIGLGTARALRARGARVALLDRMLEPAAAAAAPLDGIALEVDVTDADAVAAALEETAAHYGRVDILVNNAGVGPEALVGDMTLADWRWILEVNLWGVINGVHAVLPRLRGQGSGHIVNVASMSAVAPNSPLGGYAVTKAGVAALTEVLAQELQGSGVSASVVLPGPTRTNIADSVRHRRDEGGALRDFHIAPPEELWRTADQVGEVIADGIATDALHIVTHPELWYRVDERYAALARAFGVASPTP